MKNISQKTFLLLKWEVMIQNKIFFYAPTEETADKIFKLLERWRKRKNRLIN